MGIAHLDNYFDPGFLSKAKEGWIPPEKPSRTKAITEPLSKALEAKEGMAGVYRSMLSARESALKLSNDDRQFVEMILDAVGEM
jgi:hypothetical protein